MSITSTTPPIPPGPDPAGPGGPRFFSYFSDRQKWRYEHYVDGKLLQGEGYHSRAQAYRACKLHADAVNTNTFICDGDTSCPC